MKTPARYDCPTCQQPVKIKQRGVEYILYTCPNAHEWLNWELVDYWGDSNSQRFNDSFYLAMLLEMFIKFAQESTTLTRYELARYEQYKNAGYWLWQSDIPESTPPLTALHSITDGGVLYALMQTVGRGEWVE